MSFKGDRILRIGDVEFKVGLKRTSIFKREKEGTFPKRVELGQIAAGWLESEIDEWIKALGKLRYYPALPETGFIRLPTVLQFIPVGRTVWYEGMKVGRFPQGVKLSDNVVAWNVDDIRKLIKDLSTIQTATWAGVIVDGARDE
jgi:predicted DNA-binding transcriptional regulator AlpA